ncbi:MAG: hypothetical protein JXB07_20010 [Anaerolineae bacterium]|nr:hypothetical protein [Anaerolineae bacterium]
MLLLLGMSMLFALPTVLAQDPIEPTALPPITDDQVNAIARQLYCPACQDDQFSV